MPLGLHNTSLNFVTTQEIGQEGKNSEVYLANDIQLDAEIVVKKIAKARLANAEEYYRESKILYTSRHTHVVEVKYGCEDESHIFIAMPYYENGSLKSLIESRFLTVREIIRYSIQFLSGLSHIHSKGLIHFDIKPDNVLLNKSDEALLSDFGLAKAMDYRGLAEQDVAYMKQVPPEWFVDGNSFDKTFDIYLAGLTLYRLVNGNETFYQQFNSLGSRDSIRHAIVNGQFPNRNEYLFHIPQSLRRVINRALSVNPDERYSNVLEFINDLGTIEENLDWRYAHQDSEQTWLLDSDSKTISLTLSNNNDAYSLHTTKTMKTSGNTTRISNYCIDDLPYNRLRSTLQGALRSLS